MLTLFFGSSFNGSSGKVFDYLIKILGNFSSNSRSTIVGVFGLFFSRSRRK
jgi:hypothetical protein